MWKDVAEEKEREGEDEEVKKAVKSALLLMVNFGARSLTEWTKFTLRDRAVGTTAVGN